MQNHIRSIFSLAFASLALLTTGARAQAVLFELKGATSPLDSFGDSVTGVGDINFDGRPDILVGAPGRYSVGWQTGGAIVHSGANGLVLRTHFGLLHGDRIGSSVLNTGDLNGDGVEDYAVGASQTDYAAPDGGSIFYYSGASGALIRRVDGGDSYAMIGNAMCSLGDVNGDGIPDQAVAGIGSVVAQARVHVLSGADGHILYTKLEPAGPSSTVRVAALGDTNGDGISDLAIGTNVSNGYAGAARIVSGVNGSLLLQLTSSGGEFGTCVAAAGDVDGDGFGDVIVGAPWEGATGRVTVFSSTGGAVLRTFDGESYGQHFGSRAVRCGDFDGDGVGEYAIAAHYADHVGTDAGRILVYSGLSGAVLYRFDGDDSGANLGWSLAALGDINGDGIADLVAGQPKTQPATVKVFSGACLPNASTTFCPGFPNSVGAGAQLGFSGSTSIAANSFSLTVQGCPPNKGGLFIFAFQETLIPFGNGMLCVKGQNLLRVPPPIFTDALGMATKPINFLNTPTDFLPGANPKFQLWYRDPQAGGAGVNMSSGMSITFCP